MTEIEKALEVFEKRRRAYKVAITRLEERIEELERDATNAALDPINFTTGPKSVEELEKRSEIPRYRIEVLKTKVRLRELEELEAEILHAVKA